MRAFRAFEMREEMLGCLEDHAALAERTGEHESAARLYAAVDRARSRFALSRTPRAERRVQASRAELRTAMGEAFVSAQAVGDRWEIGQAVAQALAIPNTELVSA